MRDPNRAQRRHEERKRKADACRRLRAQGTPKAFVTERQVGILAHSPARCSCALCGNRRRCGKGIWGLTRQEAAAAMKQQESQEATGEGAEPMR